MIRLAMPWTRRRAGRHRVDDRRPHRGWEGREGELRLLAAHDETATTMPIQGLPVPDEQLMQDCPLDGCTWPQGVYADTDHDQYVRLLQHLVGHVPQDTVRTLARKDRAIEKLQALT